MALNDVGDDRIEILSADELRKTLTRLASQVLESVTTVESLLLLGIPTRGVQLADVVACSLKEQSGLTISTGTLDPTFHRDDLGRLGVRMVQATDLPVSVEGRDVVLVDDVIFTGRTVRAALEAIQAWGRPRRVFLLVMVDRGHRELPIQPDFCGKIIPTRRSETVELRLLGLDGEEGIFLRRLDEKNIDR